MCKCVGKNCGKLQEKPNKLQNKHLEICSSLFPFTRSHFPFSSSSDYPGLEKPFHLCELSEPPLFGWHLSLSNQAGLADSSCWPEEGLCCRLHRSDCCRMSKRKWLFKTTNLTFPLVPSWKHPYCITLPGYQRFSFFPPLFLSQLRSFQPWPCLWARL